MTDQTPERTTAEEAVRAYFAAYSDGRPDDFDTCVSPDYVDYGHTPPGHGPQGAKDDFAHAVATVGGMSTYDIDALVEGDDTVAVVWTGKLPDGKSFQGLSLYGVADGLVTWTRHTALGALPA